ncbi:MAG TPA: SxtJ family membrane protein [Gemmatimonadaceae bacterium]|jgi:hypothetical protein|nr:SxtJ family membrane protein [Gemmatimonadaceae bacterium]
MAEGIPARLTVAEGRKFGFTVGFAFIAIGLLLLWRGKQTKAAVVLGIGGLLVVAGLVVPTSLGPVERAWMGLAHLISKVTTPIFMGVVYFVVITPMGLIRRLAGKSPIARTERGATRWEAHTPIVSVGESMERQF